MQARRGTRDDIPAVMRIVHLVVPQMERQNNFQWGEKNSEGVFYPNEAAFEQDCTDGTLWIVEGTLPGSDESTVVGMAALTVDQPDEYGPAGLDLNLPAVVPHRMAVHPDMHGKGVANLLYTKAEDLAREIGWDRIRVDTCTRNGPMTGLIQKLGYTRYGEFTFPGKAEGLIFVAFEKILLQTGDK